MSLLKRAAPMLHPAAAPLSRVVLMVRGDLKPLAIGRGGIARDHPVGRAGAQRGVGRGREAVDGSNLERARIGHGGQQGGARIAPGVPVNLDPRGGKRIRKITDKYPDAGQRVGAGARGELCGSNRRVRRCSMSARCC